MLEAYFEAAFPNCEGFGVSMNGEGDIRKLLAPLAAAAARSEELERQNARDIIGAIQDMYGPAIGNLEDRVAELSGEVAQLKSQRDEAVGLLREAVKLLESACPKIPNSVHHDVDEANRVLRRQVGVFVSVCNDLLARIDSRGDGGRGRGSADRKRMVDAEPQHVQHRAHRRPARTGSAERRDY